MKKILISAAAVLGMASTTLHAEGWECYQQKKGPLVAKVYHGTAPGQTRVAAFMVLSDRSVKTEGRQTIATFSSEDNVLSNTGAFYTASVDSRRANIRDGELIKNPNGQGARLGSLKNVTLEIPKFSYNSRIADGARKKGVITVNKEDGESFTIDATCYRYLKGAK